MYTVFFDEDRCVLKFGQGGASSAGTSHWWHCPKGQRLSVTVVTALLAMAGAGLPASAGRPAAFDAEPARPGVDSDEEDEDAE